MPQSNRQPHSRVAELVKIFDVGDVWVAKLVKSFERLAIDESLDDFRYVRGTLEAAEVSRG